MGRDPCRRQAFGLAASQKGQQQSPATKLKGRWLLTCHRTLAAAMSLASQDRRSSIHRHASHIRDLTGRRQPPVTPAPTHAIVTGPCVDSHIPRLNLQACHDCVGAHVCASLQSVPPVRHCAHMQPLMLILSGSSRGRWLGKEGAKRLTAGRGGEKTPQDQCSALRVGRTSK